MQLLLFYKVTSIYLCFPKIKRIKNFAFPNDFLRFIQNGFLLVCLCFIVVPTGVDISNDRRSQVPIFTGGAEIEIILKYGRRCNSTDRFRFVKAVFGWAIQLVRTSGQPAELHWRRRSCLFQDDASENEPHFVNIWF